MKAFHGDPAVKEKYLARLQAHHAADEIIQGRGWSGAHGCAVGCTLNNYCHEAYEVELGLPEWLAHLEDRIFEGLPAVEAKQFAVDFLVAIPTGADVENVRWQLAAKRHSRDRDRLLKNQEPYAKQCVEALNLVITFCESGVKTESAAARLAAESARMAAQLAAESARMAAQLAECSAAESAAESARSAAESAECSAAEWSAEEWSAESAGSAEWSAESAEWSARSNHFKWEAETLLALLREAPQAAE